MNGDPLEQLRDKLKGKMEVAKIFAGFISVVFGFLLKEGLGISQQSEHEVAAIGAYAAILLFITSLTFSIATVFAYDRLLMPLLAAAVAVTDHFLISLAVWVLPVSVACFAYLRFYKQIPFVD